MRFTIIIAWQVLVLVFIGAGGFGIIAVDSMGFMQFVSIAVDVAIMELPLIIGLTIAHIVSEIRDRRNIERTRRCPSCGYDLRGKMSIGCPECGWNRGSLFRSPE